MKTILISLGLLMLSAFGVFSVPKQTNADNWTRLARYVSIALGV